MDGDLPNSEIAPLKDFILTLMLLYMIILLSEQDLDLISVTRIVLKKDNQRCGAILKHEIKNSSAFFIAAPCGSFLLDGGTYVNFDYILLGSTIVVR